MKTRFNHACSTAALLAALLGPTLPAAVQAQDYTYTDNGDGMATITGYTGLGGAVTIPNNIDGLTVMTRSRFLGRMEGRSLTGAGNGHPDFRRPLLSPA